MHVRHPRKRSTAQDTSAGFTWGFFLYLDDITQNLACFIHIAGSPPVLAQMSKGVNCNRIVGIQRETLSKGSTDAGESSLRSAFSQVVETQGAIRRALRHLAAQAYGPRTLGLPTIR
jgi:hypothetical protein